jgi:hypothetical protein
VDVRPIPPTMNESDKKAVTLNKYNNFNLPVLLAIAFENNQATIKPCNKYDITTKYDVLLRLVATCRLFHGV